MSDAKKMVALRVLQENQKQLDPCGSMVGVSRQALDEVIEQVIALQDALKESTELFREFQKMEGFVFEGSARAQIQAINNENAID